MPTHSSSRLRQLLRLPLRRAAPAVLLGPALLLGLSVDGRAQVAPETTLEEALLDVLRDNGVIREEDYDALLALARERRDEANSDITLIEASLQRLAAPDVQARGGQPDALQLGWFLDPKVWELVLRHSEIDFDAKDDMVEQAVGLNHYVDEHNGKWLLDVAQLKADGATPDADRVRLRYQVLF